jgi:hypothetical protein
VIIDDDGNEERRLQDDLGVRSAHPHERLRAIVRRLTYCHAVFGLIRTDVLRGTSQIQPFPASDVSLLYELSLRGRFAVIPEHLSRRRPGRSLRANPSRQALAAWFDPSRSSARSLGWQLFRSHLSGVRHAPLSLSAKLRCVVVLLVDWPVAYLRKQRRRKARASLPTVDRSSP